MNNTTLLQKNLREIGKRYPDIARALLHVEIPAEYSVVPAKSGSPVLQIGTITFHSLYDPVKEANNFVDAHVDKQKLEEKSPIVVFGLGLGYHIAAMLEKCQGHSITVIEPRIEILRTAAEHVDLSVMMHRINLYIGSDVVPPESKNRLCIHQPSAKYNRCALERVMRPVGNELRAPRPLVRPKRKQTLRILVVPPIYGGSLPIARYSAHALKRLGHIVEVVDCSMFQLPFTGVLELNISETQKKRLFDLFLQLVSEMVIAACSNFSPDIVIALAQAPLNRQALSRLRESNITTAFWFVEDYQIMQYWREYAPLYDFYYTIQKNGFFTELEKAGSPNYHYLPMAAAPELHRPVKLPDGEHGAYGSDISFMGAGYYNRQRFFPGLADLDFKIWGTGWDRRSLLWKHVQRNGERISPEDTVKVFNASTININLHSSVCHEAVSPDGDFVNPRTFEIASCGAFQLVDHRTLLPEHFSPGEEMICYGELDELREKIRYYLKHPDERQKIALRAQKRILAEHTYDHRMKEMLDFMYERKPDCLSRPVQSAPVINDVDLFCSKYPETRELLRNVSQRGEIDLETISGVIGERNERLHYHEAIFLFIKEFHDTIARARA